LLSSAKHFFGITATYIGERIIGSKSKNTKAAMNRRTPKSAKLELRNATKLLPLSITVQEPGNAADLSRG
jgi:hypothetical protein